MKPLKLTMQAFGPFAGREEIDFTALGDNPLFLINGQTGSGKSTILDAICFALYGKTTGDEREGAQMRCDHASIETMTELELEFQLGEKTYLIRRTPIQERPKARGEGMTEHKGSALLKELDGTDEGRLIVSSKVSEATAEIELLIGLGVDQFRQVMVLPQGKFRELLMAQSKEREEIFGQLFETHIYKQIEDTLKLRAGDVQRRKQEHDARIKGVLLSAHLESEDAIATELEELSPKHAQVQEQKVEAHKKVLSTQSALDAAQALIKQFEAKASLESKRIELANKKDTHAIREDRFKKALKAKEIAHLKLSRDKEGTKREELVRAVQRLGGQEKAAQRSYLEAEKAQGLILKECQDLDGLKRRQHALEKQKDDCAALIKCEQRKAEIEARGKAVKTQIEKQEQEKASAKIRLSEVHEKHKSLSGQIAGIDAARMREKQIQAALEQLLSAEKSHQDVQLLSEQVTRASDALAKQKVVVESARKNTTTLRMSWHSSQAAQLAQELEEDAPCPVCGSKEHPSPARAVDDEAMVSVEDIEHAQETEHREQNTLQRIQADLASVTTQHAREQSRHAQILENLGDYHKPSAQLRTECNEASAYRQGLESQEKEAELLTRKIAELEKKLAECESVFQSLNSQREDLRVEFSNERTKLESLAQAVPEELRSPGALDKELDEVVRQIALLEKKRAESDQALKYAQSALDTAKSRLTSANEQLKQQKEEAENAASAWTTALSASLFDNEAGFVQAHIDESELSALKAEIEAYNKEVDQIEIRLAALADQLKEKVSPNLELVSQECAQAKAVFDEAEKQFSEIDIRVQRLREVQVQLKAAEKEAEALQAEYAVVGTLSGVANGQMGNKISLQRFVLGVILEDVLYQASERLLKMSGGRYELLRKLDPNKGNKPSGLDLEVLDGYTNKARPVATLSGGESFMASLALALGLSDVVQAHSGGIRLDTLFIDEGFGSLDSEALDSAIQVLTDLQSSGRMIGIISHVTELKEQMAKRIDVEASGSGSRIARIAA